MHTKKELEKRLLEAKVVPLKRLGQNFLVNTNLCAAIVKSCKEIDFSTVVEVGPGLGALTEDLASLGAPFILVEYDRGLVEYWQKEIEKRNWSHVQIIHEDALRFSWTSLPKLTNYQSSALLVSNLPYSIAASLVVELSGINVFESMILMFQKEVAERIQAPPTSEDYGILSVMAQAYWQIEKVIDAGPQDFYPVPHVGSRVLRFKAKKEDSIQVENLKKVVKMGFSQRRKKLATNLGMGFDKIKIQVAMEKLGLSQDARAQELDAQKFIHLAEILTGED